jgi:hypothetical protein
MTWLVLFGLIALYFLPAIAAHNRGKANASAIAMLNFFLGWTFIGWVVALVWACTVSPTDKPPVRPAMCERDKRVLLNFFLGCLVILIVAIVIVEFCVWWDAHYQWK